MDTKNALQADRSLIELCGDWRINRERQLLIWADCTKRESLGDQNYEVDTEPLDMMKTLEDVLSRGRPKSMRGAIKMLEVAHTILTHEDPDAYMADGPVVEILRSVIKALEYCDGSEPIGEMRLKQRKAEAQNDVSNGEVEEAEGAAVAPSASQDTKPNKSAPGKTAWDLMNDVNDRLNEISSLGHTVLLVGIGVEQQDEEDGAAVSSLATKIHGLANKASKTCSQAMDLVRDDHLAVLQDNRS